MAEKDLEGTCVDWDESREITLGSVPKLIEDRYRVMMILRRLNTRLDVAIATEDYESAGIIQTKLNKTRKKYSYLWSEEE